MGLQRGDKLACVAANCRELMLLYWACLDLGLLFCPLSPKFPDSQLQELLERFHIRFIWCPDNTRNKLWQMRDITRVQADFAILESNATPAEIATVSADMPLNIILTSGSSGSPKAAVHSLNNHIANANGSRQLIPLQVVMPGYSRCRCSISVVWQSSIAAPWRPQPWCCRIIS